MKLLLFLWPMVSFDLNSMGGECMHLSQKKLFSKISSSRIYVTGFHQIQLSKRVQIMVPISKFYLFCRTLSKKEKLLDVCLSLSEKIVM